MRTQAIQINKFEKRVFAALVFAIFAFAALYGYFISASIVNVIVREEVENGITSISSTIVGELEPRYIANKDTVTVENAYFLGFENLKKKTFVKRRSLGEGGLTLNENQ